MMATYGTRYLFGVFLKPMLDDLGWTRAMTSGAFSLSATIQGFLAILMGLLNDKFGPRIVLTAGCLLVGIGYLLMSQIESIGQLYVFYGLVIGIGMSVVWIPLTSTVARWFTSTRSLMTGIVLTGTGIGALIAAPIASRLISTYDWRISYVIMGALVLLITIPAAQFLKRDPEKIRQIQHSSNKAKGEEPVIRYSLKEGIHTKQFWIFFMTYSSFGFVFFAISIHIVAYATDLGISTASAANILATISGTSIAGRIVLGNVADRIGTRQIYIIGHTLMFVALMLIFWDRKELTLYLSAGIVGFAQGGMGMASSPLVAWLFGLSSHGLIYGVISQGYYLGSAIGPFATGYIFDVSGSYQAAFLLCAGISMMGLILSLILKPITPEKR